MATDSTKCLATRTYSVFVGHLLQSITKEDLFEIFKTCGKICEVFVFDGSKDAYKYGFVRFENRDAAITAIQELNKWPLKGTPMIVDLSKETKQKMEKEGFLDVSDEKSFTNQDVRSKKKESNYNYIDEVINLSRLKESCSSFNQEAAQTGSQRLVNIDRLLDDIAAVNCGIYSSKAELIDYNPIDLHNLSKKLMSGELGKLDQALTEKETQKFFLALEVIMDSIKGFTTFCRQLNSQETSEKKKNESLQKGVKDDVINSSPLDPAQVKAKQLEDGLKQLLFSKKKMPSLSMEKIQETVEGHNNTDKELISRFDNSDCLTKNLTDFDNFENSPDSEPGSENEEFEDLRSCFHFEQNHQEVFRSGFEHTNSKDPSIPLEINLNPSMSLETGNEDSLTCPFENLSESPKISSLTDLFHIKMNDKTNSVPESNQTSPPKTVSLQDLLKNSERSGNYNKAVTKTHMNSKSSHQSKVKNPESLPSNKQQLGILGPAPNILSVLGPVPKLHKQQDGLLGPAPKYLNNHNVGVGNVPGFQENQNRFIDGSSQQDGILGPIPNIHSVQKGILGPAPTAKIDIDHRLVSGNKRSSVNQASIQKPITSLKELPCDEQNVGEKNLRAMSQSSKNSLGSRRKTPVTHSPNLVNSLNNLNPGVSSSSLKSSGRGTTSGSVAAGNQKVPVNSLSSLSNSKSVLDTSQASSDMSFTIGLGRGRGVI